VSPVVVVVTFPVGVAPEISDDVDIATLRHCGIAKALSRTVVLTTLV
jgi:hypothetical protein